MDNGEKWHDLGATSYTIITQHLGAIGQARKRGNKTRGALHSAAKRRILGLKGNQKDAVIGRQE